MSNRKSFDISDSMLFIFERDNWTCRNCKESVHKYGTPNIAHGISQGDTNIRKYGADIVHSQYNMYACCSVDKCNKALAVGKSNEPAEAERIRKLIEEEKKQ